MKHLIVSLHDFHPGSREALGDQVAFLHDLGVKRLSILVVPKFHYGCAVADDVQSLAFLDERAAAGDDLVVHGYYHFSPDNRLSTFFWTHLYTNREAEFLELSDGEVRHRVEQGLALWHKQGWVARGFIAPAWLMPRRQDAVLRNLGFAYTNRVDSISLLMKKREIEARSLCYSTRAAWRRGSSLIWNHFLFNRLRRTNIIRLSLHPEDLVHDAIKQQIREIVEMALADDFQPITYSGYAAL